MPIISFSQPQLWLCLKSINHIASCDVRIKPTTILFSSHDALVSSRTSKYNI